MSNPNDTVASLNSLGAEMSLYRGDVREPNLGPRLEHGDDGKWKQSDSKIWT
jgi:hypothetical protein